MFACMFYMHLSTACLPTAQVGQQREKTFDSLELGLQMTVNCDVGAEDGSQVPRKSSKCSKPQDTSPVPQMAFVLFENENCVRHTYRLLYAWLPELYLSPLLWTTIYVHQMYRQSDCTVFFFHISDRFFIAFPFLPYLEQLIAIVTFFHMLCA